MRAWHRQQTTDQPKVWPRFLGILGPYAPICAPVSPVSENRKRNLEKSRSRVSFDEYFPFGPHAPALTGSRGCGRNTSNRTGVPSGFVSSGSPCFTRAL